MHSIYNVCVCVCSMRVFLCMSVCVCVCVCVICICCRDVDKILIHLLYYGMHHTLSFDALFYIHYNNSFIAFFSK
jgi:hypothetical protein